MLLLMIYTLIHIILGMISNNQIDKLFLIYQTGQFLLDMRYFFFENKIEKGNSFMHTLKKLIEYAIGKIISL